MASLNTVHIIGNVGKDPDIRYMPNGDPVANFSVATTDVWKDKQGQSQERTEWHSIVAYRKLAEIIESYVKKGASVYIGGRIESRKYTDKSGIERVAYQIIADTIRLLDKKQKEYGGPQEGALAPTGEPFSDAPPDDDAPF